MAIKTYPLPIGSSANTSFTTTVKGSDYRFNFRWSSFDESWSCSLGLAGSDPAISFKMTSGRDVLEQWRYKEGVPDAALVLVDTVLGTGRVGLDNVGNEEGSRFKVYLMVNE